MIVFSFYCNVLKYQQYYPLQRNKAGINAMAKPHKIVFADSYRLQLIGMHQSWNLK